MQDLSIRSTLLDLCEVYAVHKFYSDRSRALLAVSRRHFTRFLRRDPLVEDLTDRHVIGYVDWRKTAEVAHSTIDRELCKLFSVWRFAAEPPRLLIPHTNLRLPRASKKPPIAFLDDEVQRLFEVAYGCERTIGGMPGKVYWPCVVGIVWDVGERVKAITQVHRDDIQIAGQSLMGWLGRASYVTFRERKGHGDVKVRKISRRTSDAIRGLLEATDSEYPFRPITLSGIYRSFDTLLKDAGLPHDRWSKFHRIRRSHLSYVYVRGGQEAAVESAGHSDAKILHDHYLDRRIVRPADATDLLWDPLSRWPRWLRRRA